MEEKCLVQETFERKGPGSVAKAYELEGDGHAPDPQQREVNML